MTYTSFIMADSAVEPGYELHESEAVKASKLCKSLPHQHEQLVEVLVIQIIRI